jgi:flagellar motor switch protein FliG
MMITAPPGEALTGIEKAATLLVSLGEECSAEILRHLSEDEVDALTRAITRLPKVASQQVESVLNEFHHMTMAQEFVLRGGIDYARKMLSKAFGSDVAKRLNERLAKLASTDGAAFDVLQQADPQQLARFIHSEHPQTVALVLSHVNPAQAASLLSSLPPKLRADVALRMATLDRISPEIVHKIATMIGQKIKALGQISREAYGGVRAVADMFNRLDSNASKAILSDIESRDPKVFEAIRELMFVFEDLLVIDAAGIKEITARVDRKVLTIALKGTSEQLRNHIFSTMSQRGAEMLKEDIEALGPVKIREVEAAQQQIIVVVRELDSEGVVSLSGGGSEQYVV